MNLTSCDNCGVVLDKDKLNFPEDIWDEETEDYDRSLCTYIDGSFVAFVSCPVCEGKVHE